MTPPQLSEASHLIIKQFFEANEIGDAAAVNCFVSLKHKGEVDTQPIFERIWSEFAHIRTFAPRMNATTGELESVPINHATPLIENKWEIREPEGAPADASILDLVIVPLLCFDRGGHRVGYGKGYYDRFLARCRTDCTKVGLCFFPPVDEIEDVHAGDVRLDVCVTPSGSFRF